MIIEQKTKGDSIHQKIKYVDLSYLTKLTHSNPELMTEMITTYLKQTPPLIDLMKQSFKDKEWHLLKASVHKIIPSFAIMGIDSEVTEMAKKIQELAFSLELSIELQELILALEKVCKQSFTELEMELNHLKKS
jgi:HPt (histidine-containing phosphotransfer) domain-containing protein